MYKSEIPKTEEQKQALILMWLQMREDKLRGKRQRKIDVNLSEVQNLKLQMDLEAEPLSEEEQKNMQAFEKRLLTDMSFGYQYENSDIGSPYSNHKFPLN